MKFIDNLVELCEQLLLLGFQVLELLMFDFVLPFLCLVLLLGLNNLLLDLFQILLDLVVVGLLNLQRNNFLANLLHRANDQFICIFLNKPFFVGCGVLCFLLF